MDFSGVDVVILSACNTGLGDVTSEGVAGLQKAFRQAGVMNVVLSLEAMNDDITGELFPFYNELLSHVNNYITLSGKTMLIKNLYN